MYNDNRCICSLRHGTILAVDRFMFKELNNRILTLASNIKYTVSDLAPSNERDLFNAGSLVIWSGASDNTIWEDPKVNYAFRAIHDTLHIKCGLGFSVAEEVAIGRIQAAKYDGLLADIIYIEVAKHSEHFKKYGSFPENKKAFTLNLLKQVG